MNRADVAPPLGVALGPSAAADPSPGGSPGATPSLTVTGVPGMALTYRLNRAERIRMLSKSAPALQRVLYPSLHAREMHRRACDAMSDAARRKRETPGSAIPEASIPIDHLMEAGNDGRSGKCD